MKRNDFINLNSRNRLRENGSRRRSRGDSLQLDNGTGGRRRQTHSMVQGQLDAPSLYVSKISSTKLNKLVRFYH